MCEKKFLWPFINSCNFIFCHLLLLGMSINFQLILRVFDEVAQYTCLGIYSIQLKYKDFT